MKFAAASLLILTLGGTSAFRDKSQKKNTSKHRGLEEDCVVNHHHAKTVEEIQVEVKTAHAGNGMFDLSLNSPPYAPAGKSVTTTGWCIDYSRSIEAGSYSMDVFSAFDSSIHSNAIDKPAMLPNLAWLINNVNVGDTYPSSDDCVGGTLSWWDMQGAVWMLVDNENGEGTHYETNRVECISQGLAQRARNEGEGYEPDCNDPFEMIPLVMVADNDATGEITNQVIISETLLSTIDGICECATPAPTSSPTKATDAPTGGPTASPTKSTDAPTGGPTFSPTKATDAPTGGPTASPTEATDAPTGSPTASPIKATDAPTGRPTASPTTALTESPTDAPTKATDAPTLSPTSGAATEAPTEAPTVDPDDRNVTPAPFTNAPKTPSPTPGATNKCEANTIPSEVTYGTYSGNPMCHSGGSDTSLGFDYGWKMTGCSSGTYILDTGGEITGSCEIADKITLTVECHEDKSATISWSGEGDSNVAIKVKGSHGGTLYDASSNGGGFIAGANGGGQTADISHIEVCVNCVGSSCYEEPTEPSPTASPTGSLVANPTGSPTGTHNDPPTESPTLLATCPDEQPDIGSPCGFESLDCAYDTETCCDGTEHDSFIVQCSNGVVQGHHTDACMSVVCVEPTASPTSGPTGSPVSTPTTESPTSAPTATSTQSATLPVTCPDEKPDPGSPCGFEGLDCAYGKETCCDGTDHDSFIAQCIDGVIQGFYTEACMNMVCEQPTAAPTNLPTNLPTDSPVSTPTTDAPTGSPTSTPTGSVSDPVPDPTGSPTGAPTGVPTGTPMSSPTETPTNAPTQPPVPDDRNLPTTPAPTPNKGSGSGDPHFKTWTGDKFDYHGACDLVLVDNPQFLNGLGLKLHIRTTRIKYFSYIERIALQIGSDILEFANDVDNFMINGARVEANRKHHKTKLAGFNIRRDPKAISVRLHDQSRLSKNGHNVGKIDFHTRTNGFPAVIVDGGDTSIFYGSLGLLGEWSTGRRMARDGKTELNDDDATAFALEWQVRDTEPMLFKEARFPQYPTTCTPPKKMLGNRLGSKRMRQDAEKACAHWEEDKDDCIFDVVATRSILVAAEGYIEHVQ